MSKNRETIIDKLLGGLSLMILLTTIWTLIGSFYIKHQDYYILTIIFILIIVFFIYSYLQLNRWRKNLPSIQVEDDKKKEKLYWVILIAEGLSIPVAHTVLLNINKLELFIPIFALIVGLHFFPLAKVFERKFDYYIGTWTTLAALIGIVLTIKNAYTHELINAFVCFACSFATASYGLRMILEASKLYKATKI